MEISQMSKLFLGQQRKSKKIHGLGSKSAKITTYERLVQCHTKGNFTLESIKLKKFEAILPSLRKKAAVL
jgi:hypothetical protein